MTTMTSRGDQLEREIPDAAGNLAADHDALRQPMQRGQIVGEIVDHARDPRGYPLPLLLIGAGLAWSFFAIRGPRILGEGRAPATQPLSTRRRQPVSADGWTVQEGAAAAGAVGGKCMDEEAHRGAKEQAVGETPADAAVIERERKRPEPPENEDAQDEASREEGHGRSATTPSEIPRRGWKDIVLRVYRGIADDRILANAGAVTFYVLLALFPGITALVSVYSLFSDTGSIGKQLDTLTGILPGGAIEVIGGQLTLLTGQPPAKLGFGFGFGLLIALWSANGGIKALFDALNTVYEESEKRSFIRLNALSLTFTVAMIAFLIVAITCIVALPAMLGYLPGFVGTVLNIARWPVLAVLVAIALSFIYRYGPSRDTPQWRWISWGSGAAAVGWLIASAAFSFYAANFGTFNKTYGSLGAVIGFMLWIWISVIVILLGGKLNAETEHQTARDTTEGQPEPLGERGAKMADTVGAAQG